MKPETKNCSQSCGCNNKNDSNQQQNSNPSLQNTKPIQTEEEKLNPTRFGDWEVGGRAIDF